MNPTGAQMDSHGHPAGSHGTGRPYAMLGLNMLLGMIAMYLVMFTMIDGPADFRNNLNTLYMTLTMLAPMGIAMLATMKDMYRSRRLNAALYTVFALLFVAGLAGTRMQAAIGDRQFIAAMVPHHSGAILMCREARLEDPELVRLCEEISRGQRREIEQMNAIRARLHRAA